MKGFLAFLTICSILVLALWGVARIYNNYQYNIHVGGYLKRAADANTIDLAKKQLDLALSYMEANNLTSGNTGILFKTPSKDVGFWYTNIKTSREELDKVKSDASQLEQTNVLMKLRETLTDDGDSGTAVTEPGGISVFPNNMAYALWGWLSLIFSIIFGLGWFIAADRYY